MDISSTRIAGRDPAQDWVTVEACTLPSVEQPLRLAEFDALFATSLREVHRPGSREHARLVLAGDQALPARVQRLAEAETSCCSFFTFAVTALDGHPLAGPSQHVVALDIDVPASRADVLDALVASAEAARQGAP